MKIHADTKILPSPTPAPAATRKAQPEAVSAAGQQASAQVQLSPAAQLAPALEAGIDAEKVARMSQAIADGSFKPNPEAIADKLIANAREQLAKAYGKLGGGGTS